jgi:zinc protease
MIRWLLPLGLGLAAACSTPRPSPAPTKATVALTDRDAFRARPPEPLDLPVHFEAPVPEERRLSNGALVWVYERHSLPLVSVLLTVPGGVAAEPIAKAGVAGLTARMLTEGTRTRTGPQIAEELEDLAIDLWANAGAESSSIGLGSLRETLEKGLDVLADVSLHPAFRAEDFARVQKLTLTALEQKKGSPEARASDTMSEKLYGPKHPWGQPSGGTPETVRALRPRDLVDFHRGFLPNQALFVVVGDIRVDEAVALLEARFKTWKSGRVPEQRLPPFPALESRTLTLVEHPGSQSQLWTAGHLFPANHPDALAVRLANLALGGMFSSRLNQALREEKAFSYGYYSSVQLMRGSGVWVASGGVEAKYTADALAECTRQMDRFAQEGPTEQELRRAKDRYVGSLPGLFETNSAAAGALAALFTNGLPSDYFRTLPARVAQVSREDVARVARDLLTPQRWPVVLVGPPTTAESLKALGLGPLDLRAR